MKIFFIGVNGIGVSGLAKIAKRFGHEVYGSDVQRTTMSTALESQGVIFFEGHDASRIETMDVIVYSTAIKFDNPELAAAIRLKKIIFKRGEFLAKLMQFQEGVAVAGTHGKTTTTSMCAMLFLPSDATFYIGGVLPAVNDTVHPGSSDVFISEADESDNSFLYMHPKYAIITNIEPDHIDFHESFEHIKYSFEQFMKQTSKKIIACGECETVKELVGKYPNKSRLYGFDDSFDIVAKNIRSIYGGSLFDIYMDGQCVYQDIELTIPGTHNVLNATAAIAVAHEYQLDEQIIREQIKKFNGAKRRFDILYRNECTVIDDYAHHPTEVCATLQAVKSLNPKRLIVVYQPHRYSRTHFLFEEYAGLFDEVSRGYILPIYSAGEQNIYGITEEKLAKKLSLIAPITTAHEEDILELSFQEGDIILFMGAGSITYIAQKLVKKLNEKE